MSHIWRRPGLTVPSVHRDVHLVPEVERLTATMGRNGIEPYPLRFNFLRDSEKRVIKSLGETAVHDASEAIRSHLPTSLSRWLPDVGIVGVEVDKNSRHFKVAYMYLSSEELTAERNAVVNVLKWTIGPLPELFYKFPQRIVLGRYQKGDGQPSSEKAAALEEVLPPRLTLLVGKVE